MLCGCSINIKKIIWEVGDKTSHANCSTVSRCFIFYLFHLFHLWTKGLGWKM